MTTDPPADPFVMRDDGRCARPGCTRPLVKRPPKTMPKSLRGMFMEAIRNEPYCSTNCCRAVYNVPLVENEAQRAQRLRYEKEMAA